MAKTTTEDNSQSSKRDDKDFCFVIMPFGGYPDTRYKDIYAPAIKDDGLEAKRADDLSRSSNIVNDIWNYTKECKLILADLTEKNSNVFYELGLAHALAKPAVLVTNSISEVPFDLRHIRHIKYDKDNPGWGKILKQEIEKSIKETLESPIGSVLPTFLDADKAEKTKITITEKDFLEMKQRLASLEAQMNDRIIESYPIYLRESLELQQVIRSYLDKSMSVPNITSELLRMGYLMSDIEYAFQQLGYSRFKQA